MAAPKFDDEFLLVAKSLTSATSQYKHGVHLEAKTGLRIDEIIDKAAADRFKLSERIYKSAKVASTLKPKQNRLVIARCYYSIYHATRSVVYFRERGDDFEAHSELPKHLPGDFPNRIGWENKIKNARLDRNRADYDPYPVGETGFSSTALSSLTVAKDFLRVTKNYLSAKGCKV